MCLLVSRLSLASAWSSLLIPGASEANTSVVRTGITCLWVWPVELCSGHLLEGLGMSDLSIPPSSWSLLFRSFELDGPSVHYFFGWFKLSVLP